MYGDEVVATVGNTEDEHGIEGRVAFIERADEIKVGDLKVEDGVDGITGLENDLGGGTSIRCFCKGCLSVEVDIQPGYVKYTGRLGRYDWTFGECRHCRRGYGLEGLVGCRSADEADG